MPTAGRLICRLDGSLYHDASGNLMAWPSAYPINVKGYFGSGGDEQLRIDNYSTYHSPPEIPLIVNSGTTTRLVASLDNDFAGRGYYLTATTSVYMRATNSWVEVVSGPRWQVHWTYWPDGNANFDVQAIYWSTVGVWGPYQTDAAFFLSGMDYNVLDGNRRRDGVSVPSSMYLRPT